jgi:hypothetical protein
MNYGKIIENICFFLIHMGLTFADVVLFAFIWNADSETKNLVLVKIATYCFTASLVALYIYEARNFIFKFFKITRTPTPHIPENRLKIIPSTSYKKEGIILVKDKHLENLKQKAKKYDRMVLDREQSGVIPD